MLSDPPYIDLREAPFSVDAMDSSPQQYAAPVKVNSRLLRVVTFINSQFVQRLEWSISRRAFLSGTLTLSAAAALGACRDNELNNSIGEQQLTGTFTGRLGTSNCRPANLVLGAP